MIFIANSFSLAMLDAWCLEDVDSDTYVRVQPVDPINFLQEAETRHGPAVSAVGHADTAAVFSSVLGRDVPMNRITLKIGEADEILVGQLSGARLPEGSTSLPEGAQIKWVVVSLI